MLALCGRAAAQPHSRMMAAGALALNGRGLATGCDEGFAWLGHLGLIDNAINCRMTLWC
jgi:hypothetical protein